MSEIPIPFEIHNCQDLEPLLFSIFMETCAKLGVTEEEERRIAENIGEFSFGFQAIVQRLRVARDFENEKAVAKYGYFSGYRRPKLIDEQIDILRSHWPMLNPDRAIRYMRDVYPKLQLPDWIEGPFAIIRPGFFSEKYHEEIEEVLRALSRSRDEQFCNYLRFRGEMNCIQPHKCSADYVEIMRQQLNSDILVVPGQFGIRYPKGNGTHIVSSVRRVRVKMTGGEFGEGAKNIGTMLLTHSNRLAHYKDLYIKCSGDMLVPLYGGSVIFAPQFSFRLNRLEFNRDFVTFSYDRYGLPSGFHQSPQPS